MVAKNVKPIWHFSVLSSNRGDTAIRNSIEDQIRSYVDVPIARFSCKHDKLTEERIAQLNSESSMLIIGGAGLYSNYPLGSHWYFDCSPELFSKIEVPIVLWSIGCNNNIGGSRFGELTPDAISSISKINELSALSSVRDYKTLNRLEDAGIHGVELCPDPALLLCPTNCGLPFYGKAIGINIAQHAKTLRDNLTHIELCYYHALKDYEKRGYTIVFVAHDCLEHNIYRDLAGMFDNLVLVNEDDPAKMAYAYSQMEFSVGVKMHSNILSYAGGTPFLSVYYDEKQLGLFEVLGMDADDHIPFNQLTPELLSDKIVRLHEYNSRERAHIQMSRVRLCDVGMNYAKRVVDLLGNV